jgi:TolB protein
LRSGLWTFAAAIVIILIVSYALAAGILGVYDGLKDRALENQQIAREHYTLGRQHLEDEDYELAIAEFELALRHDASLLDARAYLRQAKDLAQAQVTPTSETRRDAARLFYEQGVAAYEAGNLNQAVLVLDDLRGLDAEYQAENVQVMLVNAHYQLGLNAVIEDRLDEATDHLETVLALQPGHEEAQDQLNLIHLYTAALSYWERDWAATIQALKGLYALAPDYKDVEMRLHDAYMFRGQDYAGQGRWCQAATQYAAAVDVLPLESTVDARDDARIHCQSTAEAPTPTPTSRASATPRATSSPAADATTQPGATGEPDATAQAPILGQGRIAFASYDAIRQRQDIYFIDLAQGNARLLKASANQPSFAPDGRQLVFHNLDPAHLGLGIVPVGGDGLHELTDHAEDSAPAWSPDSKQIIFASNKHGDRKWRLYAISPGAVRGEGEEWAFGQMPAWSISPSGNGTEGSLIAYHGCDERGDNCSVWVMQPGGFRPGRLTTHASDTAPAWSPDGSRVAFISARDGNWEIYVVDIATGQERRLTHDDGQDVAPAWSPDGRQIAFLSNRHGAWAVYLLDLRSGDVEKLIATGDAYPDPANAKLSWVP